MDGSIFKWAKSRADIYPEIKSKWIDDVDSYVEKAGSHVSLYHDNESGETLMCVFLENRQRMVWWKITNFDQIMTSHASIVNLWLRNGEYLFTLLTQGTTQNKAPKTTRLRVLS